METLKLSEYELSQLQAINNWKNEKPSVIEKTVGFLFKPIERLTEQIIPKKAIEGVITTFNALARFLTDTDDIKRDACVESIDELRTKDLQLSDKLANEVHNWANAVAVAEGTGAGFIGLAGLIVDVPSLITMGFRVIHKIGVCYGYDCDTEYEKQFAMTIMSIASSNTMKEKVVSVATLRQIQVLILKTAWKGMEKQGTKGAAVIAVKSLAKKMGINVTKRKALATIPIVGASVSAAMNLAYMNDIAWAARRSYQERWLLENKKID